MISPNLDELDMRQAEAVRIEQASKRRRGRLLRLSLGILGLVAVGTVALLLMRVSAVPEDPEKAAVQLVQVAIAARDDALRARDPSILAPYIGEELLVAFTANTDAMLQEGYIIDEVTVFELLGTQLAKEGGGVFVGGMETSTGRVIDHDGKELEPPFQESHTYGYHVEKDASGHWRLVDVGMVS